MNLCVLSSDIILKNIHFTVREIDVLSGLVNGRSAKSIALLLSISPKTVETHIRNIMLKLECNSKEQILDFIEKSGYHHDFYQHYQDLLENIALEKLLKKASQRYQDSEKPCSVICLLQHETTVKCCRLVKHLKSAGLRITFFKEIPSNFENCNIVLLADSQQIQDFISQLSEDEQKSILTIDVKDFYSQNILKILETFYSHKITKEDKQNLQSYVTQSPHFSSFIQKNYLRRFLPYRLGKRVVGFLLSFLLCLGIVFSNFKNSVPTLRQDLQTMSEEHLLKRPQLVKKMNEILKKQNGIQTVVLIGPGGSGKTTLARDYARSLKTKVLYEINAETKTSQLNTWINLAFRLANNSKLREEIQFIQAINDSEEKNKQRLHFIQKRLKAIGSWCLIFDNVETFSEIRKSFPYDEKTWGKGKVIITTRNNNIQHADILASTKSLIIGELSEDEKFTLFNKIYFGKIQWKLVLKKQFEMKNFLKELPSYPLDISAATYYIKNTQISFKDYLHHLDTLNVSFDRRQSQILEENFNYSKTRYRILFTSFQKILEGHPEFEKLLLLICLVDSRDIPKSFLYKYGNDRTDVDEFLNRLHQNSFIIENTNTFSIHRSTQNIGLSFILKKLNYNDLLLYTEQIINIFTPYERFFWFVYKTKEPSIEIFIKITPHILKLKRTIKELGLKNLKNLYRLNFSLGGITCTTWNNTQSLNYLNEILSDTTIISSIPDYDYVVLLLYIGHNLFASNKIKQAEEYFKKAHEQIKKIKDNEALLATEAIMMGMFYDCKGDFHRSKNILKKGLKIIEGVNENWKNSILSQFYYQLSILYIDHYFIKSKHLKTLDYAYKALSLQNAVIPFYRQKRSILPATFPSQASLARHSIAMYYNVIGEYKKSLTEGSKEIEFLGQKYSNNPIGADLLLGLLEKGHSFCGLGRVNKAEKILSHVINTFEKMKAESLSAFLFLALKYRIETRIKSNKYQQAYNDCRQILKTPCVWSNWLHIFSYNTIYYHAAVIKYRQKDWILSLNHFADFFKNMKIFCKIFLDPKQYENLLAQHAFDLIKDPADIETCLDHSLLIFTAIYGPNHSFVKDFVEKKGKPESWFSLLVQTIIPLAWIKN